MPSYSNTQKYYTSYNTALAAVPTTFVNTYITRTSLELAYYYYYYADPTGSTLAQPPSTSNYYNTVAPLNYVYSYDQVYKAVSSYLIDANAISAILVNLKSLRANATLPNNGAGQGIRPNGTIL
jgi:hypothetical protein